MFDFCNNERTYVFLNKQTKNHEGTLEIRMSVSGKTVYAELQLFPGNCLTGNGMCIAGSAHGYGYDRESVAVADACKKADILAEQKTCDDFEFKKSSFAEHYCIDQCKVPVYAGTGNQKRAFELFFDVLEV
jgi:hypothetical protein